MATNILLAFLRHTPNSPRCSSRLLKALSLKGSLRRCHIRPLALICTLSLFALPGCLANYSQTAAAQERSVFPSVLSLQGTLISGEEHDLSKHLGKVVVITNFSLQCGTAPQLKDLQNLYEDFRERGLVVLGFPTDDFAGESGHSFQEIEEICHKKYGVTFPLFRPHSVTGDGAHDVFKVLRNSGHEGLQGEVSFNKEKFLIGRDGQLRYRFGPFTSPKSSRFREAVETLLLEGGLP